MTVDLRSTLAKARLAHTAGAGFHLSEDEMTLILNAASIADTAVERAAQCAETAAALCANGNLSVFGRMIARDIRKLLQM